MHVYQGLAVIQGAKLAGAGKIIAVDINPGTFARTTTVVLLFEHSLLFRTERQI